jgi:hypothetical protein
MIDIDNYLLPRWHQDTKKRKDIILRLLIIIGGLLIIIIVVVAGRSMRGTYAKSGQLSRSQLGIGVINGRVNGHISDLKERLIPLTVNDLPVMVNNPHLLVHHIHALIYATAHGEDTFEHLQKAGVL